MRWNIAIVCVAVALLTACDSKQARTTASAPATGALASDTSNSAAASGVTIAGQLAIDAVPEALGADAPLNQRLVDVVNAGGAVVASAVTGADGSYVVKVGQLAVESAGLHLTGGSLQLRSVIADTKDGAVIGTLQPLTLPANGDQIDLGKTQLKKITAIRGRAQLDGAADSTGIALYIPGTSYAARTDSAGNVLMTFLSAGTYNLVYEKDGYSSVNIDGVVVVDDETTVVDAATLKLAGGPGLFSVKQIGIEGLSTSRTVSFAISAGNADRFKAGTPSELESQSYDKVPAIFEKTFTDDGIKELRLVFATADGFETTISRTVNVDTIAPDASHLGLADRSSLSKTHSNERRVIAYDPTCTDIDRVAILPATTTAPRDSDFIWPCNYAPTSSDFVFSVPNTSTEFAYKIWARDAVGNISANPATGSIIVDTTAPAAPAITLRDQTSSSVAGSDITVVDISVSTCDDIAFLLFSESQTTPPDASAFSASCSTAAGAYSYTFANNIAGAKTVLVWAKDFAGNVGPVSASATIILDQTKPVASSFSLADPTPETAGYSNSLAVHAVIASCADTVKVFLSETQTTRPGENDAGWVDCQTSGVTTSLAGQGSRTVYLWAMDVGGNISDAATTATIMVDTVAPSAPSFSLADVTNGSTTYSNAAGILAAIGACGDAAYVYLSESATAPTQAQVTTACAGSLAFNLNSVSEGVHTVYLWSKDIAGNVSASPSTAAITVDTTPPVLPASFTIADLTSASTTFANARDLDFTVSTCPAGSAILIKSGQNSVPAESASEWQSCVTSGTAANLLTPTEGSQSVYLWVKDAAGNIQTTSRSQAITYDVTPPTAPGLTLADTDSQSAAGYTNSLTVKATIASCSDVTGVLLSESFSTPAESAVTSACVTTAGNYSHTFSGVAGTKTLVLWLKDAAGNVAYSSASIVYDTDSPAITNVKVSHVGSDSLTVSWTTSEPVPTKLIYGTGSGSLTSNVTQNNSTTSHAATATALTAGTVYYFAAVAADYAEHTTQSPEETATTYKVSAITNSDGVTFMGGPAAPASGAPHDQRQVIACDFNNDSYEDIVVSAPQASTGGFTKNGSVYVLFGGAAFAAAKTLAGDADIIYKGGANDTRLGNHLACLDFNGDGFKDLLLSQPDSSLYLVYGSNAPSTGTFDISSNYSVRIWGLSSDVRGIATGYLRPTGAGSTDAYEDIVICAPNSASGCRIYYGSNLASGSSLTPENDGEPRIYNSGNTYADRFGRGVSIADVDGDGLNDVVIGDMNMVAADFINTLAGGFYVLKGGSLPKDATPGAAGGTTLDLNTVSNYAYSARGSLANYHFAALQSGDIDGDGNADLMIRNPDYGSADWVIVFGRAAGAWSNVAIESTGLRISGLSHDTFPNEARAVGNIFVKDLDGDSKAEIVVGSDGDDSARGRVCIFRGRSQAGWASIGPEITLGDADMCLTGADSGDFFGLNLSAGKIKSTTAYSLIVAAPGGDGTNNSTSASGEVGLVQFAFPSTFAPPLTYSVTPHF